MTVDRVIDRERYILPELQFPDFFHVSDCDLLSVLDKQRTGIEKWHVRLVN